MYGYAEIRGRQFRLVPGGTVKVPSIDLEVGSGYEISPLLMFNDGQATLFGKDCANVKAKTTVVEHGYAPKIIVLRKKRRKGFKVRRGHRQGYSLLRIDEIVSEKEAK